jgi:acyl-homoserine lactone acylase PvdQ
MRRAVALALVSLAAVAAGARADVRRAETVLPPGESGFVRDAGSGAGSPHRFDQLPLFVNFRWKPALFGQPGTAEKPKPGVRIVRDKYGVPAVTAGNDRGAWFGVGYAVAQDRLTELELFRRRAYGTLAAVLGEGSLADDVAARRDLPGPAALDAEVTGLPPKLLARARAYRDGVNRWIAHVRKNPSDEPAEFKLLGVPLRDWTLRDTAAVGALLVRNVPWASQGREVQNAIALRGVGAKNFERLVPLHAPKGAPLIIPPADGTFPSQPGRTRADERAAFKRSRKFVAGLKLPPSDPTTGPAAARSRVEVHGGSYVIAARRGSGGVLYSGPQLGFSFPELLYEVEVNRPGLHVHGDTAPGAPVVAVGFNRKIAWGVTSGESDTDDLYAEKLAGGPERYRFRGKVRKMSCRNEVFDISGGSSKTERLCRSVHGPVQFRAGNWAYARRFATFGRELETVVGLDELDRAGSVKGADRALRDVTWNENVTAVDSGGHIGFWHPGLLPLRPKGFDERLPYPGDGSAEWHGFLPVSKRPHVIDPTGRNWLANWNNIPSAAWTSGDGSARGRIDGPLNHTAFLYDLVRSRVAKHPTLPALERLLHRSGTIAQQRPLVEGKLMAALQGSTGRARAVLRTLVDWDGSYARTNGAGTVSPGVATWQEFKDRTHDLALGPMGPGALQVDGENASYHYYDASNGVQFGLRTLGKSGYRKAAAATFAALAKRFGTTDPSKWRDPRHMYPWTLQGAGSPPPIPFFERGTYEQLVDVR